MKKIKIKSIKRIEKPENTYNLHVEDNHNYFANGINVSNCHLSKGKSLTKIAEKCYNSEFRIGMSGTLPERSRSADYFGIVGSLGSPLHLTSYDMLQEKGNITKININQINFRYSQEEAKEFFQIPKSTERDIQFIIKHPERTDKIIEIITQEIKKGKNVSVLFTRIKHGEILEKKLKELGHIKDSDYFISTGSVNKEKRQQIYKYFEENSGKILLASFGVFYMGINIKNLHSVFFYSNYKSFYKVLQTIGRSVRLHDSKDVAEIFDFGDILEYEGMKNSSQAHIRERQKTYDKEGLEYSVDEIQL